MDVNLRCKQARQKRMRHELIHIWCLKLEGLHIRLNWEFKLTMKISCMAQINMSSRWTARIKVEDREACFKRLRKRRLGGNKETDTGQRPEILESWRALCWRVSLFKKRRWLVNQGGFHSYAIQRFKVTSSKRICSKERRCWCPHGIDRRKVGMIILWRSSSNRGNCIFHLCTWV